MTDSATDMGRTDSPLPAGLTVRHEMRAGDIGELIRLHGELYAREQGYDLSFEAYVAGTFGERTWPLGANERIWMVERAAALCGSIAIVQGAGGLAQLRWLLLRPELRGLSMGRRLVSEALAFCRACSYPAVFLWTEGELTPAISLYRSFGFVLTESSKHEAWGGTRTDERYELALR